jgi:phage/plasmid primase-like uncharacterized protein
VTGSNHFADLPIETIDLALSYIDANCDRDTWARVGMALKNELGEPGFDVWDTWSRRADNYTVRDARDTWRSIRATGGVTIATVIHMAKENGYRPDAKTKTIDPAAAEARRAQREQAQAQEAADRERRHAQAAADAKAIWDAAQPATTHAYIARKQLAAPGAVRVGTYWRWFDGETVEIEGALLIPLRDPETKAITTLQAIFPDAGNALERDRDYLPGGRKQGCYFNLGMPTGEIGELVTIGEGYATCASVHQATVAMSVVAFDAGNLLHVAKAVRRKLPHARIVLLADNDRWGRENTGVARASEAAQAIGGLVATPQFASDDGKPTDFNDLHVRQGLDAVRLQIEAAAAPQSAKPSGKTPGANDNQHRELTEPEKILSQFLRVLGLGFDGRVWIADARTGLARGYREQELCRKATLLSLADAVAWAAATGSDKFSIDASYQLLVGVAKALPRYQQPRTAGAASASYEPDADEGREELPVIEIIPGQRADVVSSLAKALAGRTPYFRREGDALLVRALALDGEEVSRDGVRRSPGSIVLRQPKAQAIVHDASRVAVITKFDARKGLAVTVDLPESIANTFIELGGEQNALPILRGIVRCPPILDDGSIRAVPGYDPVTRIYLAGSDDWSQLRVPDHPTQEDAKAAVRWLLDNPLHDFPYVDDCSRAVALSAILTSVARASLGGPAPMHGFSAPSFGAGKSLQAELVHMIAVGDRAATMAPGHDQQEFEKRVDAAILAGDPVLVIDNISWPLGGDNLCSAATSDFANIRPLGTSQPIKVRTSSFWMATGANLTVKKDMHRRSVISFIDPRMSRPETRTGFRIPALLEWAKANRMALLSAAYTILRAHARAGHPECGERPLGSFEAWSRKVANCLVWLGMPNPARSQEVMRQDDLELQAKNAVADAICRWQQERPSTRPEWTMAELRAACEPGGMGSAADRALREAVAAGVHRGVEGLQYWLRGNKGQVFEDRLRLDSLPGRAGVVRWSISAVRPAARDGGDGGLGGDVSPATHEVSISISTPHPVDNTNDTSRVVDQNIPITPTIPTPHHH